MDLLKKIIDDCLDDFDKDGPKPGRSLTIHINGKAESFPVISVPVNQLILNKDNHRLSAQIEDAGLESYNYFHADEGQSKIANLLKNTPQFAKLKQELKDYGQREPALITPEGLLVNGNTRCVALREIAREGSPKAENMDVAVLKKRIKTKNILDIEIDLQMVKLTTQDYSFTNKLRMVQKILDTGLTPKQVGVKMGWLRKSEAKVNKHIQMLNIIKEIRGMSKPSISYETFDRAEQIFNDIYDKMKVYENEEDYQGAQQVKYNRIIATLFKLGKDQIRNVDADILSAHRDSLISSSSKSKVLDLLNSSMHTYDEDFDDESEDFNDVDGSKVLSKILSIEGIIKEDGSINESKMDPSFDMLKDAMNAKTDELINLGRRKSREQLPSDTLRNLRDNIKEIKDTLPEILKSKISEKEEHSFFNNNDFDYLINKSIKDLKELKVIVERFLKKNK
jgi:hypothetical protein